MDLNQVIVIILILYALYTIRSLSKSISRLEVVLAKKEVRLDNLEEWKKQTDKCIEDIYWTINEKEKDCIKKHPERKTNTSNINGNGNIIVQDSDLNNLDIDSNFSD